MNEYIRNNESAIVLLHEIYGINRFIEEICIQYHKEGFDVFCPNLYDTKECFAYENSSEAYSYFINEIGFNVYKKITALIKQLKNNYKKIIVIGFSVGATIAWRCSEISACDAVICYYGSRIRDFLFLQPQCPVYLMFAENDSFDVDYVCEQLEKRRI